MRISYWSLDVVSSDLGDSCLTLGKPARTALADRLRTAPCHAEDYRPRVAEPSGRYSLSPVFPYAPLRLPSNLPSGCPGALLLGSKQHCLDDVVVTRASADIVGQRLAHLLLGRLRITLQKFGDRKSTRLNSSH